MSIQLLFGVIFIAAAIAYNVWMRKNAARSLADARPAFQSFFERTGYCYADLWGQPVEAQVDRAYADANITRPAGAKYVLDYVRNFHGLPVRYHMSSWTVQHVNRVESFLVNHWSADLPGVPRIPIHIADKSLASMTKLVGEAFTNTTREFSPKCSMKVTTGVPEIDAKFVVYAEHPDAAKHLFAQNPGLAGLLLNWAEVDVYVTAAGACFNDPSFKNMNAAMGGMIGSMSLGLDYSKRTEMSIPVHDRAAELLGTLVRATA